MVNFKLAFFTAFFFSSLAQSDQSDQSYFNGIHNDYKLDDSFKESFNPLGTGFEHENFDWLKPAADYVPSGKVVSTQNDDPSPATKNIEYKILISESMGFDETRKLIKDLSYRNDIAFYIKGMKKEDKNIGDPMMRVSRLVAGLNRYPAVYIDPRPFREVGAEDVPVILAYEGERLISFARGTANPNFMDQSIEDGKRGNLGVVGELYPVVEIEMAQIIAERWDKLDKQKIIKDAKESYWSNVEFIDLPRAIETKVRRFKPVISAQKDITKPDGGLIVRKGTRLNTLDAAPFTRRVVVFDATEQDQIDFVKSLPNVAAKTILVTTKFDRELKWDGVKEIQEAFGANVSLLNSDLVLAFDLEVVPSVVVADNFAKEFVISEYR